MTKYQSVRRIIYFSVFNLEKFDYHIRKHFIRLPIYIVNVFDQTIYRSRFIHTNLHCFLIYYRSLSEYMYIGGDIVYQFLKRYVLTLN